MGIAREVNVTREAVVLSQQAAGGAAYQPSETTRLLCAAAYLDRPFRDLLIKSCLENKHRANAPNFGVDMPEVLHHCELARRTLNSRELWLLLVLVIAALVLGSELPSGNVNPMAVLLFYAAAFAICLVYRSRARTIVIGKFLRGKYRPSAPAAGNAAIEQATAVENGNVLVYSGFTPFVGSGENIGGWSFAVDLSKEAEAQEKRPNPRVDAFFAGESASEPDAISLEMLYVRIAEDIEDLQLEQVSINDKLYINGRDIRDDKRFLDHPLALPRVRVDQQIVAQAMLLQADRQLRHYRCFRVVDWDGELVLSMFLRFSKRGKNLFVESSYFLLTPVGERFRAVDSMSPQFNFAKAVGRVIETAFLAPFNMVFAPFILFSRFTEHQQHKANARQEEKLILENPAFDYGANFSCRQWASPHEYRRYFQKLDKEMYLKVLEKRILDSIITCLEENNVDVSELKQRQSVILNNGVIVSGGNMTTENLSVGANAKVESVAQKVTQFAAKSAAPAKQAS